VDEQHHEKVMTSSLITHFQMLSQYNKGANQRLYDACSQLDDSARKLDRLGFFKSIHGTLNHILVGDRIWLTRFRGGTIPSTALDAILYVNFEALRDAREDEDRMIESFFESVGDAFFSGDIHYNNNEGRDLSDPISLLAAHFFNHQTHHRGQVHDMLSQAGIDTPVLDMHRTIRP
jgi:uncharacterized damage-inducible protein DinB